MKEKKYLVKEEWTTTYDDSDLGTEHFVANETYDSLDEVRSFFKTMFIGREKSELSYIMEDDRAIGIKAIFHNYDGSTDTVNVFLYEIREMRLSAKTFGDYDEILDSEGRTSTE